uniref:Cystathionine gamma-synthase n=1 Tax=Brassica oleracea var. oleracea TaxID=109376 RepID=A0A0D3AJ70_BRAOL
MALYRSISLRSVSSDPQPSCFTGYGRVSSFILRFPPNIARQLSTKARGNCNFSVAQTVVAKWSNSTRSGLTSVPAVTSVDEEVLVAAESVKEMEKRVVHHEYGRYGNPTTLVLEKKISSLNFFWNMEPVHLKVLNQLWLWHLGCVQVTVIDPVDTTGLEAAVNNHEVSMFFTESPTNPFLRCVDIELVSEICHKRGTLVCIDGTLATPLNQKALALGADLVVHSATKYIGGHNDVLGGCVCGSMELVSAIRNLHHVLGGTLNPNAAYLLIRGIKTMHLRLKQQNSTALRMAQVLEAHPKVLYFPPKKPFFLYIYIFLVSRVYYPGLISHPEHHIAKRQMNGFGGVVSFEIAGDLETTIKFVDSLNIPYIAPSFGGCESIVDQPAIMSYWDLPQEERLKYGIKDNLVRFSFGIEDFDDVKADVLQALGTI